VAQVNLSDPSVSIGWRLAVSLLTAAGDQELIQVAIAAAQDEVQKLPTPQQTYAMLHAFGVAFGAMSIYAGAQAAVVDGLAGEGRSSMLLQSWVALSRERGFDQV
jgi:hypothetical protein